MMKQLPDGLKNTIEDAIQFLGGTSSVYMYSNEQLPTIVVNQYDMNIVKSLAVQLDRGLGFTEKQGDIGIRLVKRYEPALRKFGFDIETITFDKPFRVIDRRRTLHVDGDRVVCKSNFIADLVNQFKKRKSPSYFAGQYDGDNKEWNFAFNEQNIDFLLNVVKGKGFTIDQTLVDINKKNKQIKTDGLKYFPLLTIQDNKFTIINSDIPQEYLQPFNDIDDPAKAILYSKMLGVSVYDDCISKKLGHKNFKKIFLGDHNTWTVNRKVFDRKSLLELINPSKQTMIMVSSVDRESLIEWIDILQNANLLNQTCITFRYKKDKEMNDMIKEKNVNSFDPANKILITNEKINKNFVKHDINPDVVIVDLATEPSHYKTQTYLANKSLLVYYTHKGDTDSGIL